MYQRHAQVILTDSLDTFPITTTGETEQTILTANPIGIDTIRQLTAEANRRPRFGFTRKHIFVRGVGITVEAQQAALKILEEPPPHVTITWLLPTGTQLLETVLSRVSLESDDVKQRTDQLTRWLALPLTDRLAEVEARTKAQDVTWINSIKTELQIYLTGPHELSAPRLREVNFILNHVLTRGASNKMLLEQLAFSLPLTR
jgi:hypothetical protein